MSRSLAELPIDVLVDILHFLDVKSLLRMERTCSHIRELVHSRSVWLRLLAADLGSTQQISDGSDICGASIPELKKAVVEPARFSSRCLDGVVPYKLHKTVSLSPLGSDPESPFAPFGTKIVKLLPGGRFLFAANFRLAYIIDLEGNGEEEQKIIWKMEATSLARDRRARGRFWISHIAYEYCIDGSITIVVVAKNVESHDQHHTQVHRLIPLGDRWTQHFVYSLDCKCRDDEEPFVSNDYVVLPGVGMLTIINWRSGGSVRAETPHENSVAEPLRAIIWQDHLIFTTRSFFIIHEIRSNFRLNALYLPPLFVNSDPADPMILLDGPNMSTFVFHNTDNLALVQLSDLAVSSWWTSKQYGSRNQARLLVGAKFWEAHSRSSDFFSVYDIVFDISKPSTERFTLQTFPRPQLHPLEEANTRTGYNAGLSSLSSVKSGAFLYSTYRSQGLGRPHLYLSFVGISKLGRLFFAQIKNDFKEYQAMNRSKCLVPVEERGKSLLLLALNSNSVEILQPV